MNDEIIRQAVQNAIDSCLSDVHEDPDLVYKILRGNREKRRKKRLSLALVLVIILSAVAVTALAIGIYETIKPAMGQSASLLLEDNWGLENKLCFVEILRTYGLIDANDEQLSMCMNSSVSDTRLEQVASALIERLYGKMMQEQTEPSVLQQEEYSAIAAWMVSWSRGCMTEMLSDERSIYNIVQCHGSRNATVENLS